MSANSYNEALRKYIDAHPFDGGDSGCETVLDQLYQAYAESHESDPSEIGDSFEELYRQMNGMSLQDTDKVIYPVCKLCRDHEKVGFIEGIKVGIRLQAELIE